MYFSAFRIFSSLFSFHYLRIKFPSACPSLFNLSVDPKAYMTGVSNDALSTPLYYYYYYYSYSYDVYRRRTT